MQSPRDILRTEIITCRKCELHANGTAPVPFRGKASRVLILGEAPGRKEDELGYPFVGPAGRFLWRELLKVGIPQLKVMSTNALCCRPQGTPTEGQIYACRGNLYNQVLYSRARWVLALGKTINTSLGKPNAIKESRGEWYEINFVGKPMLVLPTYHPAFVLQHKQLVKRWRIDLQTFAEKVKFPK